MDTIVECTCVEGELTDGEHHESNCAVTLDWVREDEDCTGTVEDYEDWQ